MELLRDQGSVVSEDSDEEILLLVSSMGIEGMSRSLRRQQ
jgi:hypothetical protein